MKELTYTFPEEVKDVSTVDEYLLLDLIDNDEVLRRGVIMPFTNKNFKKGVVLRVGPGKKINEIVTSVDSAPNDIVLYDETKAKKVSVNSKTLYLVKESEGVLAKVGEVSDDKIELYGEV